MKGWRKSRLGRSHFSVEHPASGDHHIDDDRVVDHHIDDRHVDDDNIVDIFCSSIQSAKDEDDDL